MASTWDFNPVNFTPAGLADAAGFTMRKKARNDGSVPVPHHTNSRKTPRNYISKTTPKPKHNFVINPLTCYQSQFPQSHSPQNPPQNSKSQENSQNPPTPNHPKKFDAHPHSPLKSPHHPPGPDQQCTSISTTP